MKIFGNKKILITLIGIIIFIFFWDHNKFVSKQHEISKNISSIFKDNAKNEFFFIAHAGGGINNSKYTNSLEAINKAIKNGYKLIEIDLIETSDKKLVGAHDWKLFSKLANCCENKIPNLKEFNSSKILENLTPVDYNMINKIFSKNKELILVTDKTNNFDLINDLFIFDDKRIIVEVFGRKNYFDAIKKGIKNPMYSASIKHTKNEMNFINDYNIQIISVNSEDFIENYQQYKKLKNKGVIIFVYTTNDLKFVNETRNTASSFYSDFININSMICESSKCETY